LGVDVLTEKKTSDKASIFVLEPNDFNQSNLLKTRFTSGSWQNKFAPQK